MAQVLVIEDNSANLELMTYLLEAFGYMALSASDGVSGLALARSALPDLIICDVQLPDIDGYAVARQLKADPELRSIPLLAVTALAMVGDRDQILAAGFDGYIAKPIVPEAFVAQAETFLPVAQRAAQRPTNVGEEAAEVVPPPVYRGITILVVDDRPLNHELMRSVLEPFGYTVVTASGVYEAVGLAQAHHPDLIVSDLHMPNQSGFDMIRAIKDDPQLRDIKILIHSATVKSEQDRREAIRLGAAAFITRPMEPTVILTEITACLQS